MPWRIQDSGKSDTDKVLDAVEAKMRAAPSEHSIGLLSSESGLVSTCGLVIVRAYHGVGRLSTDTVSEDLRKAEMEEQHRRAKPMPRQI